MRRRSTLLVPVLLLLVGSISLIAPGAAHALSEWTLHRTDDGKHPNAREQALLWLMNRARQDPSAEGRWLAYSRATAIAAGREAYRVNPAMLVREFDAIAPAPPAAFDARLYTAAIAHARDQISRDVQDHEGQLQKVTRTGVDWESCRGNVFSYASNPLNTHAAFNIDWGVGPGGMQPGRGHRKAIMASDRPYTNVGLAAVVETNAQSKVGELVVVGNHCSYFTNTNETDFNRFVVGTVWRDKNDNDRYDIGEGVSGVTVVPSTGPYYAVTSRGGGYAFPIRANVSFELSFVGAGLPGYYREVKVGRHSELVDYQIDSSRDDAGNSRAGGELVDGPEHELIVGNRFGGRYGWKFGSNEHRGEVAFNFDHDGIADYELRVNGFDIDNHNDVDVFVNDARVSTLKPTPDNVESSLNRIVVSNSVLNAGLNKIRFVKRRPGERWGISRVLLLDYTGPTLNLLEGTAVSGYYGYGETAGSGSYAVALHTTFSGSDADLTVYGSATDIDFDGEVAVYLNGLRLATLPITGDESWVDFSVKLPRRRQREGSNDLEFRLDRARTDWAIGNLVLRR